MLFRKGKKIVIAGSSQWGARLAGQLSGKGYDVVVVDSRRDAFRKLRRILTEIRWRGT